MRPVLIPLTIALLCAATCVYAGAETPTTHYRWRDANGGLHFSDSMPPSAVRFGYDVLNDQGMLVRHVERELTPAERAAAKADAARATAARHAAEAQARSDRQLLDAYASESELNQAHQEKLAQMQQEIATTQTNLRSQEQSLADLLAHASELERSGNPVPPYVHKRIADQRNSVAGERNELARMQQDKVRAGQQMDAEMQRYRMLRAKAQSESSTSN